MSSGVRANESMTASARLGACSCQSLSMARPCASRRRCQFCASPCTQYGSFSHMNAVWRPSGAWLGSNSVGHAPHITVGGMVPASWWRTMSPNWSTWSSPRITMNARASSPRSALAR
jgi:hypothetical protein